MSNRKAKTFNVCNQSFHVLTLYWVSCILNLLITDCWCNYAFIYGYDFAVRTGSVSWYDIIRIQTSAVLCMWNDSLYGCLNHMIFGIFESVWPITVIITTVVDCFYKLNQITKLNANCKCSNISMQAIHRLENAIFEWRKIKCVKTFGFQSSLSWHSTHPFR